MQELLDVLVDEGVVGDVMDSSDSSCGRRRQLAIDEEVSDLEEGRLLAELFDRDAAVLEDPGFAVDVGDRRAARGGIREGRVEGHHAEVFFVDLDLAEVHRLDRVVLDRQLVGATGAIIGHGQGILAGGYVTYVAHRRIFSLFFGPHRFAPWPVAS